MVDRRKSLESSIVRRVLWVIVWSFFLPQLGQAEDDGDGTAVIGGADYAAHAARASTGGRVLDVQPLPPETGQQAYEVRVLLQEGRVRRVRVDAVPERQD
jgi:hypothetical protein